MGSSLVPQAIIVLEGRINWPALLEHIAAPQAQHPQRYVPHVPQEHIAPLLQLHLLHAHYALLELTALEGQINRPVLLEHIAAPQAQHPQLYVPHVPQEHIAPPLQLHLLHALAVLLEPIAPGEQINRLVPLEHIAQLLAQRLLLHASPAPSEHITVPQAQHPRRHVPYAPLEHLTTLLVNQHVLAALQEHIILQLGQQAVFTVPQGSLVVPMQQHVIHAAQEIIVLALPLGQEVYIQAVQVPLP